MQSRLAATAARFNLIARSGCWNRFPARGLVSSANTTGRTADPAIHAVDPEEVSVTDAIKDEKRRHNWPDQESTAKDAEPYIHTKSGPKLESQGVGPLPNPIAPQKRRSSNSSNDWKKQTEEQVRDNKEYFKHHKASPLSEIEIADTRKPISQATDGGGVEDYVTIIDGSKVKLFSEEQQDTVHDSLQRAMDMYRSNAMRGDPESPHGKILRQMRGEDW